MSNPSNTLASSCTGCSVPLTVDGEFRNVTVETYAANAETGDRNNVWMAVQKTADAISRQRRYARTLTGTSPSGALDAAEALISTESIVELTPTEARALANALLRSAEAAAPVSPRGAPTYTAELDATAAAFNRAPATKTPVTRFVGTITPHAQTRDWSDAPANRRPVPFESTAPEARRCVYCHLSIVPQALDAAHGNELWTHATTGNVLCYPAKGRQSSHAYPARTLADIAP